MTKTKAGMMCHGKTGRGLKQQLDSSQRQEHLNNIRRQKDDERQHGSVDECKDAVVASDSLTESGSVAYSLVCENQGEKILFGSTHTTQGGEGECSTVTDTAPGSSFGKSDEQGEESSGNTKTAPKTKRQLGNDVDFENPHPRPKKSRKPFGS